MTVDAPVARPRPAASKPSPDQLRARTALACRVAAHSPRRSPRVPFPNAGGLACRPRSLRQPGGALHGYAGAGIRQISEPILNTPKTITVLTKDVLTDQNSTTLKQAVLNTAGVTLGTGEGGNAFGDRFFIRGFDARNDIFLDGVRDAGVSVRGKLLHRAGRNPARAGLLVRRPRHHRRRDQHRDQAGDDRRSFYNMDTTFGTDHTKRVVLDVNQVISPTLAVRAGGLFQDAGVAGRDYIKDDRDGGFITGEVDPARHREAVARPTSTPTCTDLPDFGVPYYRPGSPPGHTTSRAVRSRISASTATISTVSSTATIYQHQAGHRDHRCRGQHHPRPDAEQQDQDPALGARLHRHAAGSTGRSRTPLTASTSSANPQSRYQVTENFANQTEATYKFDTAGWKHTALGGVEVSREIASIDQICRPEFGSAAGRHHHRLGFAGVSVFYPADSRFRSLDAIRRLTGLPTKVAHRHHERLCDRHRQLQRLRHPQSAAFATMITTSRSAVSAR